MRRRAREADEGAVWISANSARTNGYKLESVGIMESAEIEIAPLQPGEKVIGSAYITQDGEIVFSPHAGAIEVMLVEPQAGSSGPWAIRRRPQKQDSLTSAGS